MTNSIDGKLGDQERQAFLETLRQATTIVDSGSVELVVSRPAAADSRRSAADEQTYKAISKALTDQFHRRFTAAVDRVEALEKKRDDLEKQLATLDQTAARVDALEKGKEELAALVTKPKRSADTLQMRGLAGLPRWAVAAAGTAGAFALLLALRSCDQLADQSKALSSSQAAITSLRGRTEETNASVQSLAQLDEQVKTLSDKVKALEVVRRPAWLRRVELVVGQSGDSTCLSQGLVCYGVEPNFWTSGGEPRVSVIACNATFQHSSACESNLYVPSKNWRRPEGQPARRTDDGICMGSGEHLYVNCVDWAQLATSE